MEGLILASTSVRIASVTALFCCTLRLQDEDLARRATSNPIENFQYAVDDVFFGKLIERMDANQDIFNKVMEDADFRAEFKKWLTQNIYRQFNR